MNEYSRGHLIDEVSKLVGIVRISLQSRLLEDSSRIVEDRKRRHNKRRMPVALDHHVEDEEDKVTLKLREQI
jgi:hypothetical protein